MPSFKEKGDSAPPELPQYIFSPLHKKDQGACGEKAFE
jgi:hypothetical protein